ncbi:methyltransferase domain-containing protein [Pantoea sp.]|uniref:methyltransferase domain-containing protein n=1 Tax=Pantoea sp. TaxID=69393 RepID=UPI0031D80B28
MKSETLSFEHSAQYWDDRYRLQGNSGAGSYGCLADFKAEVINDFVAAENIQSVMEFGCGDGNQLSLARYPRYTGFDISEHALQRCKQMYANDASKDFYSVEQWNGQQAELALSLDVLYHLIEDTVFEQYMETLFSAASRFVIIYASNDEKLNQLLGNHVKHVRHRKFTQWVIQNMAYSWDFHKLIPNKYPFSVHDQNNTSFANFYIFRRSEK